MDDSNSRLEGVEALEMLRQELAVNPTFLAQCEHISDSFINQYIGYGQSGSVLLLFTSMKIAALSDEGKI